MVNGANNGTIPGPVLSDPQQEQRIRRAQQRIKDASDSLYLAHRELEMALRLHSLSVAEVEKRVDEMLNHE